MDKINATEINFASMKHFFDKSEKSTSAMDLTKQFNDKFKTKIHYNDFQAFLYNAGFPLSGVDNDGYNMFAVQWKKKDDLPEVIIEE